MNDLAQRVAYLESVIHTLILSDRYVFNKMVQFNDGRNIQFASGTGSQIATDATQKLGFYGATPVVRPTLSATPTAAQISSALQSLGLTHP